MAFATIQTRSKQEITDEISKLQGLRNRVPQHGMLGNDNRAAIDAQIRVLNENLSKEQAIEEFEGPDDYILSNALDAAEFLAGEGAACSESWAELVAMQAETLREDVEAASRD
jgi:hypothetical protein